MFCNRHQGKPVLDARGNSQVTPHRRWNCCTESDSDRHRTSRANLERLATAVGERMSLGLANLKPRAILREQSIRDSLAGLFNRRHME